MFSPQTQAENRMLRSRIPETAGRGHSPRNALLAISGNILLALNKNCALRVFPNLDLRLPV